MKYLILFIILFSTWTVYCQSYLGSKKFLHKLQDSKEEPVRDASSVPWNLNQVHRENPNATGLVDKEGDGHADLSISLEDSSRELGANSEQYTTIRTVPSLAIVYALRHALLVRGMNAKEVGDILEDVTYLLHPLLTQPKKRGWNRFSVRPRFAPFGTKLAPGRKFDDGSGRVLRYGRKSNFH